MKDVFRVEVSQTDYDFSKRCIQTAKDFGLLATTHYERMTFNFPLNTCHYRVVVEGEDGAIEKFKSFMGIGDQEEDNFIVPMLIGLFLLVVFIFVMFIINPNF